MAMSQTLSLGMEQGPATRDYEMHANFILSKEVGHISVHVIMHCSRAEVIACFTFLTLTSTTSPCSHINMAWDRPWSLKGRSALKTFQVGQASSWSTRSAW